MRIFSVCIVNDDRIRPKRNELSLLRSGDGFEDNIKMDLKEIKPENVDWIAVTQNRDKWWATVNTIIILRVSQKVGNFLTS
jgi:hypothetical protein